MITQSKNRVVSVFSQGGLSQWGFCTDLRLGPASSQSLVLQATLRGLSSSSDASEIQQQERQDHWDAGNPSRKPGRLLFRDFGCNVRLGVTTDLRDAFLQHTFYSFTMLFEGKTACPRCFDSDFVGPDAGIPYVLSNSNMDRRMPVANPEK